MDIIRKFKNKIFLMKIIRIYSFILVFPLTLFGQNPPHSIDDHYMQMNCYFLDNDMSINTHYNTNDACSISWKVIKDSVPSAWEFSFCFPICYAPGVTAGQDVFASGQNIYLNCHMYPNGQPGYGVVQMEITTNGIYKDTVTWTGLADNMSSVQESDSFQDSDIVAIYNLYGKTIQKIKNPGIYIIEFKNGIRQKRYLSPNLINK